MKSPFPGMDPFIEACDLWGDFHDNLIVDMARELQRSVSKRYVVRLAVRGYIALAEHEPPEFRVQPDITIAGAPLPKQQRHRPSDLPRGEADVALEDPVLMHVPVEYEHKESYIDIYRLGPERELVTSIEVLSPSNKRYNSPGWDEYLRKRRAFLQGTANFVEIDLLREGRRMPMSEPWPDSPYYVLVAREDMLPRCEVWPIHSLRPISKFPVPLRKNDGEVLLNIQPLIDGIYERSRYGADIRYDRVIDNLLDEEIDRIRELKAGRSQAEKKSHRRGKS